MDYKSMPREEWQKTCAPDTDVAPLPWSVREDHGSGWMIYDAKGESIQRIGPLYNGSGQFVNSPATYRSNEQARKLAEFIVKAANAQAEDAFGNGHQG